MEENTKKGIEEVDNTFDKAERIWDRFQKLLLKIVGGIVGISLAVYVAYDQVKDKHEETIGHEYGEHTIQEDPSNVKQSSTEHEDEAVITKKSFIVDDFGHRKGDTVYVDYYSDGWIDKYYKTDGKIYYAED